MEENWNLPEHEWRMRLPPICFHILREKGTEPPFSGKYCEWKEKGIYKCRGCRQPLFTSEEKYDSKSGWPSFFQPISSDALEYKIDKSLPEMRTEVLCKRCHGHLGHVFEDGPPPTHKRFCINSAALEFEKGETL